MTRVIDQLKELFELRESLSACDPDGSKFSILINLPDNLPDILALYLRS